MPNAFCYIISKNKCMGGLITKYGREVSRKKTLSVSLRGRGLGFQLVWPRASSLTSDRWSSERQTAFAVGKCPALLASSLVEAILPPLWSLTWFSTAVGGVATGHCVGAAPSAVVRPYNSPSSGLKFFSLYQQSSHAAPAGRPLTGVAQRWGHLRQWNCICGDAQGRHQGCV